MKALFFITIIVLMISCVSAADTQLPTVSPVVNVLGNGQVQLSGTASDTSNDVNVTPGITRVEARLNSGAWVTCSGTTSFEYIFSDLSVGSHVIGVRAIDRSLNPSEIVHVDFSLSSSDVNVKDNDLSWYITIDNLHFETMRDFNNVLTVDTESDVSVNFKISNDHSQPVNLRWIISKGSLEFKDNVQVRAGRSVSVDQWISGVYITEGTHRFTVTLIDWDTKETVAEKTITLNVVKPSKTTSSSVSSNSEFPEWFLEMAKLNGWTVPTDENQDVAALKTTIESQNRAISDMQIAIADLKASGVSQTPVQNPVQSPTNNDAEDKKYYWAAGLAIIAYLKRDWIREKISSDDSSDNDDVFTQRTRLPPEVNESVFDDLRT